MRIPKQLIKTTPFIILLVNGILIICAQVKEFEWIYFLVPQISGHGVLIVIHTLFYARIHRYCLYSFVAIYSLLALNILNVIYFFVNLDYYKMYSSIIVFGGILLSLIFILKKWKNQAQY